MTVSTTLRARARFLTCWLPALVFFALLPEQVAAQTITTGPVAQVPIASPWVLLALLVALLASGAWVLRRNSSRFAAPLVVLLGLAAGSALVGPVLRAQLSVQFTNPAGETLAIPVNEILVQGALQGFVRVDFSNSTQASLRIAAIDPPSLAECFPNGVVPLAPPATPTGTQCAVNTVLASGQSCRVDVDAICKGLSAAATAVISVSPATLTFAESSTGMVTVTTSSGSPVAAANVVATIPGGSSISVQSTTCGASLAPGASCQMTFASSVQESATVTIAGTNTAPVSVALTVAAQPQISITAPVVQNRVVAVSGSSLSLEVTNDAGSLVAATGITVSNKATVPNLSVDDSNCVSVAPGASCTLLLSSNTPYAPGLITISGNNTANSPVARISFSYLGGLVFEESAGSGKVVSDVAQGFNSQWTSVISSIAGAASLTDGVANTNAIVVDGACSGSPASCAAQRCRDIGADWYLPARDELVAVAGALCSSASIPCDAGGFSSSLYWSSTQFNVGSANGVLFPSNLQVINTKGGAASVRCVRPFGP